jgi:hypothetical protein
MLAGIDALRLYRVGEPTAPRALSAESRALVEAAIEVMNSGGLLVLLCWPPRQVGLPAIVDLLILGDVASAPQKRLATEPGRIDTVADAPMGLRTVLFPQRRRSHGSAREVQVDRHDLATLQLRHALRGLYGDDDAAFKDYHTVLSRVGAMTGRGKDGRSYAEYEHPVLDELAGIMQRFDTRSAQGADFA